MKNSIVIIGLALLVMSCNSRSGRRPIKKHVNKEHNVYVRFAGKDSEIPKDGELMVVKASLEDTVIVGPATDDDCRRVLENHGKG
jgi:hypothetical protein